MIPIIQVVGYANSGKTYLITHLIRHFQKKGYRIAAIKHHSHPISFDEEGKDTWKHRNAGANQTLLVSGNRLIQWEEEDHDFTLEEVISKIDKADLLMIEGFKDSPHPKILLLSKPEERELLMKLMGIMMVISTFPLEEELSYPVYRRDQMDEIAAHLEEKLGLK
ncbi:molybdopterin-guanine dinucleotide biosynthesis protein B [Thermicanus aegyptius]|uniref:molybdopterin-guanine dinucleotide biosynthesis protein B n=1 Tax=Thermicanus aegyptius TaxID=94009 RepID=UPI000403146A|nr:molybdopterin-guanine dinucleotide biosynthesis protein B [Thermicanus aegyptius]